MQGYKRGLNPNSRNGFKKGNVFGKGRKGFLSHKWKGGRRIVNGYVRIYAPDNVMCDCQGYVLEHRLLMSEKLGRPLLKDEHIHHINGVKCDNNFENLELTSLSVHIRNHRLKDGLRPIHKRRSC